MLDRFDADVKGFKPTTEETAAAKDAAAKAKAEGKRVPRGRGDPVQDQHNPTVMFNGMIAPVIPYAIRGVLWYQGESITAPRELFPRWNERLITDWRKLWDRELPFYFCQLAALYNASNSPEVREWQAQALRLPNTAMAVTIDIGDRKDVHPHDKAPLGHGWRASRSRATTGAISNTPARSLRIRPSRAARCVSRSATRARARGEKRHGENLRTRGTRRKVCDRPSDVERGRTIALRSPEVAEPRAARYTWANYPEGANLYNSAGLPAAPFRTDGR